MFRFFIFLFSISVAGLADDFKVLDAGDFDESEPIQYVKKVVQKKGDTSFFSKKTVHLAIFDSEKFAFKVIDNGDGKSPVFSDLKSAAGKNSCVVCVNGGFFLEGYAPSGLQISEGKRTGKFGTAKLLSGAIFSDDSGLHLIRRAEFRDRADISDLIQAGPFLIDRGKIVAGAFEIESATADVYFDGWKIALGDRDE